MKWRKLVAKYSNHGKLWDEQEDNDLWNMRMAGDTIRECAMRLARSQYSVDIRWRRLKRERLSPPSPELSTDKDTA